MSEGKVKREIAQPGTRSPEGLEIAAAVAIAVAVTLSAVEELAGVDGEGWRVLRRRLRPL